MGIVKKQVYKNTIVSYAGMAFGFVNLIFLYPHFMTTEQIGLFLLLISLSVLYSLIASMGVPSIILRYFPFFRSEDKTHNGFLYWIAGFALIGFVASTLVFYLLKPVIVASFIKKAALFVDYYYYLVPLAFFTIFFNLLEALGKAIFQSIYSSFLKEVLLRLLTTVALVILAFHWITFQQFIVIYILLNGLICVLLAISLVFSGNFSYRRGTRRAGVPGNKAIINFGLFTLLSSTVYVLLQNIDRYMLSAMAGLAVQGVYGIYSGIAIAINVPQQALSRTTYQIVAESWATKDLKRIDDIYAKTSIIQMVVGCLLFACILVNKDNLLGILHKKEFSDQYNVLIVICLGFLVDITGGLNTYIITTSHKYRLITILVIIWSIFCVALTYLLIPPYGGMGAATAYLVTITGINFCTWFYLKYRFKMQPFNYKHIIVIGITIAAYLTGRYFWNIPNLYLDAFVRTSLTAAIYLSLSYLFRVSADLNEKVDSTFKRINIFSR
ncbi:MAG TPA: polysaccharide biosynthesis C-terminal domain-containing protein [Mucilaginibacter sp.]|nr:polysaccharide biosynthesis C-terminal domain-containing protein [Mucilaginibacter sp.]